MDDPLLPCAKKKIENMNFEFQWLQKYSQSVYFGTNKGKKDFVRVTNWMKTWKIAVHFRLYYIIYYYSSLVRIYICSYYVMHQLVVYNFTSTNDSVNYSQ